MPQCRSRGQESPLRHTRRAGTHSLSYPLHGWRLAPLSVRWTGVLLCAPPQTRRAQEQAAARASDRRRVAQRVCIGPRDGRGREGGRAGATGHRSAPQKVQKRRGRPAGRRAERREAARLPTQGGRPWRAAEHPAAAAASEEARRPQRKRSRCVRWYWLSTSSAMRGKAGTSAAWLPM